MELVNVDNVGNFELFMFLHKEHNCLKLIEENFNYSVSKQMWHSI